jgi:hypothetical protein
MTNLMGIESNPNPVIVPHEVKINKFGCNNCLWASCECKQGSMYQPKDNNGCKAYTYYD